jgi:hypothetical protein
LKFIINIDSVTERCKKNKQQHKQRLFRKKCLLFRVQNFSLHFKWYCYWNWICTYNQSCLKGAFYVTNSLLEKSQKLKIYCRISDTKTCRCLILPNVWKPAGAKVLGRTSVYLYSTLNLLYIMSKEFHHPIRKLATRCSFQQHDSKMKCPSLPVFVLLTHRHKQNPVNNYNLILNYAFNFTI